MATLQKTEGKTGWDYYLKLVVCLLLMFCFKYVPAWGGITPVGMAAIGIFAGLVLMIIFEFGLIQASCLAIVAVVNTGLFDGNSIIGQTLGNTTVLQMLFMFAICSSLVQTGAGEFIAKWLLSRKWIQGKPVVFCCMLLFVGWLCGPFMGMSGLILIYSILDYVDDTLGYSHEDSFSMMIRLGCQTMCMLGMAFLPFKGITPAIYNGINGALKEAGVETSYGLYMIGAAATAILFMIGFLFLTLVVFRCNVKPLKELDVTKMEGMKNLKITVPQIYSIVFTMVAILYTLITLIIPKGTAVGDWMNKLTLWVWAALVLALMTLVRYKGKPVLNAETLMTKIMWGVALSTAAFTVVGGMLSNAELGVRGWISTALKPVFSGMGFPIFLLVVAAVATIITNFFSNMATGVIIGAIVAPFCVTYCETLGVNGTFMCLALVQGAMFAFLTMAAAGPAPLLLGQEAYVKKPGFIWSHGVPVMFMGILANWLVCLAGSYIFG